MREAPDRTAAICRGDPAALEQVVREVLPGLLRAARAAGLDAQSAEDAVQDAVLVFVARSADFDGRATAAAWLHGILVHKIQERRKVIRRELGHDAIDDVMESRFRPDGTWARPPAGPDRDLALAEVRIAVGDCLELVPDRQRMAFTLREVEGFTTGEICKILEVSANNLGVLLFRARNHLRECLESKHIEGSRDAVV